MKSLENFRVETLLEEQKEQSDYSKFDMLVRAGLANKAQLQRIHKILDKMQDERPQFNNADRQILQNLFNKMVDLLSNNKQIFQKTRQAVREEVELDESMLDTSTIKILPSGRKERSQRFKIGDVGETKKEKEDNLKEAVAQGEPPYVLVLKRKAYRYYPNNLRVALYYNERLDKYFSVPYIANENVKSVVQAENYKQSVMQSLYDIVENKRTQTVVFENDESVKIDYETASLITEVYDELNESNKQRLSEMIEKNSDNFYKVAIFAANKQK